MFKNSMNAQTPTLLQISLAVLFRVEQPQPSVCLHDIHALLSPLITYTHSHHLSRSHLTALHLFGLFMLVPLTLQ